MKKILCFGDVTDKYKNAIENAMRENVNIIGWEQFSDNYDVQNIDDETVFMKCDIHSDDFLRQVIAINKKINNGEKFFLTHCGIFFDKSGKHNPFILTDAACIPMPDENQLTHIVQNAVSLYHKSFDKDNAPFISLISAGGDTNTKISPLLHSWYIAHMHEFPKDTLRIEQLDVALDLNVRHEKHLIGKSANIIVVDNINTGNAIFKSVTVLGTWEAACFIMGAKNTVILNSRSATKTALTKNILLACKD